MPAGIGSVVRSVAGHDANLLYVVLSEENGFVTLADGKLRPLEKPKRKSVKHIRRTNRTLELSGVDTNKKLREALRAVQSGEGGNALV